MIINWHINCLKRIDIKRKRGKNNSNNNEVIEKQLDIKRVGKKHKEKKQTFYCLHKQKKTKKQTALHQQKGAHKIKCKYI